MGALCGGSPDAEVPIKSFDALLVDLDGVVTKTAAVHAAAWKKLFDEFLSERAKLESTPFQPFDIDSDYPTYVDGKPRYDGVRSFLASRGISLPEGESSDGPGTGTICGLGNTKNQYFNAHLKQHGAEVFDDAIALIHGAKSRGLKVAIVSSSKNCTAILDAAGLADLFDAQVDGLELARLGLPGKPAPDMFLEAARRLGVEPQRAAVLEDAVSGVQAGRAGGFGLVVGVDRVGQAEALRNNGADVVVSELSEGVLELGRNPKDRSFDRIPRALEHLDVIARRMRGKRPAVFLDYDGTLTPIVERPELAVLSDEMRAALRDLAELCTVAIVSGRDRADVVNLVRLDSVVYAGSHGFDITGPKGLHMEHEGGAKHAPALREAADALDERLGAVKGALVERKKYAVAVHYRLVAEEDFATVETAVEDAARDHPELRQTGGKKIFELRPRLEWDKGKAVMWLLGALDMDEPDVLPFYLGDDLTDEDAFKALESRGIGLLVAEDPRDTRAHYMLRDPDEAGIFLRHLITNLENAG
ncbi:MAG: trehalose-phosphatase [Gemmatimonadales bacterium]|nr:trehalose-phosphatase [Gemmatimonadales bacterium]NIN10599.1 trehalose-phosphatase [Gemmatimonadales bacterium]NIN49361.1 trehalose-phosphatase [Gemmatimonadales bacterium]NIP06825.1 trehalose-phosphatase [Gemmatimonadales bacterium]NIR01499.1 trehalose-phosphatase [Gemmatimonadales bacterium]